MLRTNWREEITKELKNVMDGKGTPRNDDQGNQKIFEGRELEKVSPKSAKKWKGAKEWDVPGTSHRILEKNWPNGNTEYGAVIGHVYKNPPILIRFLK